MLLYSHHTSTEIKPLSCAMDVDKHDTPTNARSFIGALGLINEWLEDLLTMTTSNCKESCNKYINTYVRNNCIRLIHSQVNYQGFSEDQRLELKKESGTKL